MFRFWEQFFLQLEIAWWDIQYLILGCLQHLKVAEHCNTKDYQGNFWGSGRFWFGGSTLSSVLLIMLDRILAHLGPICFSLVWTTWSAAIPQPKPMSKESQGLFKVWCATRLILLSYNTSLDPGFWFTRFLLNFLSSKSSQLREKKTKGYFWSMRIYDGVLFSENKK